MIFDITFLTFPERESTILLMADLLFSITGADIDATGEVLHGHGPESEGWARSKAKAMTLANDEEFQTLIQSFLLVPRIYDSEENGYAVGMAANAVGEYGTNFDGHTNAADVSAAWRAVMRAMLNPPTDPTE